MHKIIALKEYLQQLQHVSVFSPPSGSVQFELAKVNFVKQSINLNWCG
jgi:hypothetical protein